jgi:hypothetical protein
LSDAKLTHTHTLGIKDADLTAGVTAIFSAVRNGLVFSITTNYITAYFTTCTFPVIPVRRFVTIFSIGCRYMIPDSVYAI